MYLENPCSYWNVIINWAQFLFPLMDNEIAQTMPFKVAWSWQSSGGIDFT